MLVNLFIVIAENSDLEKTFCDIVRNEYVFALCITLDQLKKFSGNDHRNIPNTLMNHFGSSDLEIETRLTFLLFPPNSDSHGYASWQEKMNDSQTFLNNCYHDFDIQVLVWFVGDDFFPEFLYYLSPHRFENLNSLKDGLRWFIRSFHKGKLEENLSPPSLKKNTEKTIQEIKINDSLEEIPFDNHIFARPLEKLVKSGSLNKIIKVSHVGSSGQEKDFANNDDYSSKKTRPIQKITSKIENTDILDKKSKKKIPIKIYSPKKATDYPLTLRSQPITNFTPQKKSKRTPFYDKQEDTNQHIIRIEESNMIKKTLITIFSSHEAEIFVEKLQIKLNEYLNNYAIEFKIQTWRNSAVFGNKGDTITGLLSHAEELKDCNGYAICCFTPDDEATIRGIKYFVSRDNVWLEYGLFAAGLDVTHVFAVVPIESVTKSGTELNWHKPSDFARQYFPYKYADDINDMENEISRVSYDIATIINKNTKKNI